jgi:hypothetical protein
MTEDVFKNEILIAFEYSFKHSDWVHPLQEALSGVTAEEAGWRAGPDSKGIWDIVLHVANWNENIIQRMRTGEKCRPAEGAWPPPPEQKDEAAWITAQQRLWNSLTNLEDYLRSHTVDELAAGPYGLGDLFCRFIHLAYHLGQITKMREWWDAHGGFHAYRASFENDSRSALRDAQEGFAQLDG